MRPLALTLALFVAAPAFLAGCKSPCRQLSEKLCECEANTPAREQCLREASSNESQFTPTEDQQAACEALLPNCDCRQLESTDSAVRAEAKRNCGLANAPE
jgi:hypothetical protein